MIDYDKPKTRRGLWKKTEQPGYVKKKCRVDGCQHVTTFESGFKCIKCGENVLIFDHGCQHEPDGMRYTSNPPQKKCIKCGEFYR